MPAWKGWKHSNVTLKWRAQHQAMGARSSAGLGRGLVTCNTPNLGERARSGCGTARSRAPRLNNVWRQTVLAAASVPFVNQPSLVGWPAQVMGDPEDPKTGFKAAVDDQNQNIGAYWSDLFLWKLVDGVRYTLVTKPETPGDAYFVQVAADQMLEPLMGSRDGHQVLAEARIMMPTSRRVQTGDDPEKWPVSESIPRVLVYRTAQRQAEVTSDRQMATDGPPVFRYARKIKDPRTGKMTWVWEDQDWQELMVRAGSNVLDIPLYPHYGRYVAPFRGWPVFEDTASQQAAIWRKTLDYDSRVYKDSRSILLVYGAEPGQAKGQGPNKEVQTRGDVMYLPSATNGDYVETTGAALKALRDDMEVIEETIRIGNLRPVLSQPSLNRTATEVFVYQISASSQLEQWVLLDFGPLRDAMAMKCRLDGLDPRGGDIDLPHDFSLNSEITDRLWQGYISSGGVLVPPSVIWPEMRRAQAIGENVDPANVAAEVERRMSGAQVQEVKLTQPAGIGGVTSDDDGVTTT